VAHTDYLTLEDLIEIAQGVLGNVVVRDIGLLQSAASRPQASAFGELAYPTFADQAAALMHSLARNHPLVDGNKRLAWAGTRAFLLINGRDIDYTVDQAESLVLAVARGEVDVEAIAQWLRDHSSTSLG
jgi:death-on-curing protein